MNIICKFVILEAAVLSVDFALAYPALAEEPPLSVGDFGVPAAIQPLQPYQIINGDPFGTMLRKPTGAAVPKPSGAAVPKPAGAVIAKPNGASRLVPSAASRLFHYPLNSVGDFPLPDLNFPREINQHNKVAPSLLN